MNESDLIKILKENADFSRVTEASLAALIRSGEMHDFEAGNELIRERESGQRIWILVEGELEALVDGELLNRISAPGEVVGQISAVSLTRATATVRIVVAGRALCVSHRALHEAMEKFPDLAEAMLRSMAKYLGRR